MSLGESESFRAEATIKLVQLVERKYGILMEIKT